MLSAYCIAVAIMSAIEVSRRFNGYENDDNYESPATPP